MRKDTRHGVKALIRKHGHDPESFPYEMDIELAESVFETTPDPKEQLFLWWFALTGDPVVALKQLGYKKPMQVLTGFLSRRGVKEGMKIISTHIASAAIADVEELRRFWTSTMRDPEAKITDRTKCSELLGKGYGVFSEKLIVEQHGKIEHEHFIRPVFQHLTPGAIGRSLGLQDPDIIDVETEDLDDLI